MTDTTRNRDPYDVLQVQRTAVPEVVRAAYRALAWKYHPDAGAEPARMVAINDARRILGNPVRRAAYDRSMSVPARCRPTRPNSLRLRARATSTSRPRASAAWRHGRRHRAAPAALSISGGTRAGRSASWPATTPITCAGWPGPRSAAGSPRRSMPPCPGGMTGHDDLRNGQLPLAAPCSVAWAPARGRDSSGCAERRPWCRPARAV